MVFDINDEAVKSVEEVVQGMREATSTQGNLKVTVFQDAGTVVLKGYFDCNMDIEAWDEDYEDLAEYIQNMTDNLTSNCVANDERLTKYLGGIVQNVFKPFVTARAHRIVKLRELKAPQIIVSNEIKAFAYYWILNQYCETL